MKTSAQAPGGKSKRTVSICSSASELSMQKEGPSFARSTMISREKIRFKNDGS